jgi:predicted TIM-barrel fold metal-dependent hydrolase
VANFPLFDSLVHPTLTGKWRESDYVSTFEALARQMNEQEVTGACAVGLAGVEGYDHTAFIQACRKYPALWPVAGFDISRRESFSSEMTLIRDLGFGGIKIHPRFSHWTPDSKDLAQAFSLASKAGLIVFFCTYFRAPDGPPVGVDPYPVLLAALQAAPKTKVVLVHGGVGDLKKYATLAANSDRLLLDLSFTMCKYPGTSLDGEMMSVIKNLGRKICVGSDFPEFSLAALRERFFQLAQDLPEADQIDIGQNNISHFLGRV